MALTRWDTTPAGTTPIQITNLKLNANSYELFKGTPGYEDSLTLAGNMDGLVRLQPNVAPVSPTQLFQIRSSAGVVLGYFDSGGTLYAQNLMVTGTASINLLPITGQNMPSLLVTGVGTINNLVSPTATINSLNVGAGGVVSIRDDASYQYRLTRNAATPRIYGLAISATGDFVLDDATAGSRRLTLYPTGGLSLSPTGVVPPDPGLGNFYAQNLAVLLGAQVLGIATPTMGVSNLSPSYNRLMVEIAARGSDLNAFNEAFTVTFNSDQNNVYNYQRRDTVDNNTTFLNAQGQYTSFPRVGLMPSGAATTNAYGSSTLYVDNYASSVFKSGHINGYSPNPAASGGLNVSEGGLMWMNTAAVTSIIFGVVSSANFAAGSQIRVYGLP